MGVSVHFITGKTTTGAWFTNIPTFSFAANGENIEKKRFKTEIAPENELEIINYPPKLDD